MIFVVTGSGQYPFVRLLKAMDEIAGQVHTKIIMQTGQTKFSPLHAEFFAFLPYNDFLEYYQKSELIVSHAAGGPLVYSRYYNKPIILVPRRPELGELCDSHQLETAATLETINEPMRMVLNDISELEKAVGLMQSRSGQTYQTANELVSLREALAKELTTL